MVILNNMLTDFGSGEVLGYNTNIVLQSNTCRVLRIYVWYMHTCLCKLGEH